MNGWRGPVASLACLALGFTLAQVATRAADVRSASELARKASWNLPAPASVRDQALAWLDDRKVDPQVRAQIVALWTAALAPGGADHVLDILAVTFASGDERASKLVEICAHPRRAVSQPETSWLDSEGMPPFVRDNLKLVYGRWLTQESLYDEALAMMGNLSADAVADPASLLFYQSVIHHRVLDKKSGLASINKLLEQDANLPKRYISVARLMQADLESLEDESLDHIARRMEDIRRRLELGRAGPKVREVEDGVIASLDKLIDELEKARQKHKAASASAKSKGKGKDKQKGDQPQIARPMQPLDDSRLMPDDGEGEVDKKEIGNQSGWGDLPPRKRQEALQQIGQDFPAHYRDMIEQYFRKLASETEAADAERTKDK